MTYFRDVVAYRPPYEWGSVEKFSPGGVATAGMSMMKHSDSTWWSIHDSTTSHGPILRKQMLPDNRGYQAGIELSREEKAGHYGDISNGILWALLHSMPEHVDAAIYTGENRRQYGAVSNIVSDYVHASERLSVEDYHWLFLPDIVRKRNPDAKISFDLHTQYWNPRTYEYVAELPNHEGIQRLMRDTV